MTVISGMAAPSSAVDEPIIARLRANEMAHMPGGPSGRHKTKIFTPVDSKKVQRSVVSLVPALMEA
jgi:hypothetical protein